MKKPLKKKALTLSDVAKAAGVSAITVSRALRQPDLVSADVLTRVRDVVERLGYVPDPAAQALASRRTDVIGVLIPSVTNYVFAEVLRGIYTAVESTRYRVQLGNTRYSALEEEKLVRVFLSQRPAGLAVAGVDQSASTRRMLEAADCPIVQLMETGPDPIDMMIGFSHLEGATAATEHLIARGYRRIAFLGARMDPRTQRRLEGYRRALAAAGLTDPELVFTTPRPSTVTLGAEMFGDLIARRPDLDGVFCNNDDLALGVLFESQRRHMDVPGALGICGFNDFEMAAVTHPRLTSVRTHRGEMGQRGMEMLIAAIEGRRPDMARVDLGFEVIERESTRRG